MTSFPTLVMPEYTSVTLAICSALILSAATYLFRRLSRSRRFLPGPPAKLIIGNIFEVSPEGAWTKFTEYKDRYGDLVFFHGLGNYVLVVNTMKAINDFLDKRSAVYSDRPSYTVAGELMNLGKSTAMLPYGAEWRAHRRLAHAVLNPTAVKRYHSIQEDLAILLCQLLLQTPDNFYSHVRLIAEKNIMSITYGFPVEAAEDEYTSPLEKTMHMVDKATVPGAYLADLLPFLKYAPSWFQFQKDAKMGRDLVEYTVSGPFEQVKREIETGKAPPSLARDLLSSSTGSPELNDRVKWTMGSMYGAGSETTYATMLVFILAMALHPEKQRLAQDEIDRVVGANRFPSVSDRPQLPYVGALIREVMRWHPVVPLGLARKTARDDEYNGHFIPKGTIVIPNVWAVAFAPGGTYDEHAFVPERFLDGDAPVDPFSYAFGFAKRICPGKHLAENSLFIFIAGVLSVFNISPHPEEPLVPEFTPNLISHPVPFKCCIAPRSPAHEIITNFEEAAP